MPVFLLGASHFEAEVCMPIMMTTIIQVIHKDYAHHVTSPRERGNRMKVSKLQMAEHRDQIIESAARQFRESGFDGISVSDVMKEAGLTHGGFYGHFDSKEELMALASQRAVHNSVSKYAKMIDEAP